jgi:predicted phage baseplate assembly protein
VSATYRVGLGEAGNVKSGQLRVLLSRLLGVRGVTNPQPAAGGADPEGAADARQNVPYQALTLDRIVSLRDYEDFARAFGGVGKARADWLWDGSRGVIYVTVVDAHGKALDDGSRQRLEAAMVEAHDPAQYFETSSTDALRFCVNAQLILDPHWHAEQVLEKATAALRQAFSLTRREFGQDVTESEILSLLQSVEGVIAANVIPPYPGSNLKATDWETEWKSFRRLTAQHPAYLENAEVQLADLWLLDESLNAISLHPVTDFRASELEGGAQ